MKIQLTSVLVDDQTKAKEFYTEVLGFVTKKDVTMGEYRYLTLTPPEGNNDVELCLEPIGFPEAKTYQKTLFDKGIPSKAFMVTDINKVYESLKDKGVKFHSEPVEFGPIKYAMFEDGCGNMLQICERMAD